MQFLAPALAAALLPPSVVSGTFEVAVCTADRVQRQLSPAAQAELATVLDAFGQRSAAAQGIAQPFTDLQRLLERDDRIYLALQRHSHRLVLLGGLKVGTRRLWLWPPGANTQQAVDASCVLDFYVCEAVQRSGIGRRLFGAFLAAEGRRPEQVALDRPSLKCLAFMARHWGLAQPTRHPNNFVTFPGFFPGEEGARRAARQHAQQQQHPGQAQAGGRDRERSSAAASSAAACGASLLSLDRSMHGFNRSTSSTSVASTATSAEAATPPLHSRSSSGSSGSSGAGIQARYLHNSWESRQLPPMQRVPSVSMPAAAPAPWLPDYCVGSALELLPGMPCSALPPCAPRRRLLHAGSASEGGVSACLNWGRA
ncbi:hypothetical protein ABPG75_006967 [Micractinium tetrahymenae]